MKVIRNLAITIVIVPIFAVIAALAVYFFSLPNAKTAADAENFGQIFEKYQSQTPRVSIPKNDEYLPLLSCANCVGLSSGSCDWMMASQIAMKVEGRHSERAPAFAVKSLLLGTSVWLRYDKEQLQRLYVAVYTSLENYDGVGSVCKALFKKGCRDLSNDEVIYLAAWIRGRDYEVNRLKANPDEFAKRRDLITASCRH
jgi:hypothetical protein